MQNPSNYYSCNSNGGAVMVNSSTALGNANQQNINSNEQFQHHQLQQQHQQHQHQQVQHMPHQRNQQQIMMQMQHQHQHQNQHHQQQHQQVLLQQNPHLQHNIQQQYVHPSNRAYMPCNATAAVEMQPYDRNVYEGPSTPTATAPYYHHQQHLHHHQRLVSLDGIQSGVPTLTTSTLTPTTLRNIEQTFIELVADTPNAAPYQAGFVPPRAPFNLPEFQNETNSMSSSQDSQNSWPNTPMINEENSLATTDTSSVATANNDSPSFQSNGTGGGCSSNAASTSNAVNDFTGALAREVTRGKNSSTTNTNTPSRRNQGGRRPTKATNMSPEEEEKRRVRRERNKLAAARCRKRRVDQTNELLEEVSVLEKKKCNLIKEVQQFTDTKDQLEKMLAEHNLLCRKIRPTNNNILMDTFNPCDTGRGSPLDLKPVVPDFDLKCVKSEPNDQFDSLDGESSSNPVMLSHASLAMVPPLPNVSTISSSIPSVAALNTPTITNSPPPMLKPGGPAKQRPSSLNVPLQVMHGTGKPVTDINGVAITTPSSGVMFNFESLMDGGTGLTPVSGPLIPNCSSQNKHPLELSTPTSEPSKLVSL